MHDIWTAIITGFSSKAGTWIVLLVLVAAAFCLAGVVFLLQLLAQVITGGERTVQIAFRFAELHVLGLAAALVGSWSLLTAGLSVVDGPYRQWLTKPASGVPASAVQVLGVAVWAIVGLMAWRIAIRLVVRAYRVSSYA